MAEQCALCRKFADLKNSHIIPEFMYRALYDHNHRFSIVSIHREQPKLEQKGLREKLLCQECESLLSRYERYVSEVFSGKKPVRLSRAGPKSRLVTVTGLDYHKFRVFGLSIIWRAGVAQNDFFSPVQLGPHEERLRRMVLSENSGNPAEYGFMLGRILSEKLPSEAIMVQPTHGRFQIHRCYRFVFGGFVWVFFVSSHNLPKGAEQVFIDRQGKMHVLETSLERIDFMMRGIEALGSRLK